MMRTRYPLSLLLACCSTLGLAQADDAAPTTPIAPHPLIDMSLPVVDRYFVPSSPQVTVAITPNKPSVDVTIQPGDEVFPGITLKPVGTDTWDLSPFSDIEAQITNTCSTPLYISLRIDADSWENSNSDGLPIDPGKTATVTVNFGSDYGQPGKKINTSGLSELLVFSKKVAGSAVSFRIESIVGAGVIGEKPPESTPGAAAASTAQTPPVNKNAIRVTPANGLLLGAGAAPLHPETDLVQQGNTEATLTDSPQGQVLHVNLKSDGEWQEAGIKPTEGRWRLVNAVEVRAKVRNDGTTPVRPILHVVSNGGSIKGYASAPLAPGAETEIVASYINPKPWTNTPPALTPNAGTGNHFISDMVASVLFAVSPGDGHGTLTVTSIQADAPPAKLPEWLGLRPPVEGDWTKTFEENFDGTTVDETKWNIYAENYWDNVSHFSRDNVIIDKGMAQLRYEKRTGFQADDPTKKKTDYATGYLGTFGKFTQRYGYWEARMKVPTAPGLWPAFWLMPDRGEKAADRETTEQGGMEFDIMEYLSEWGPGRYNIAMHWDGYGTQHKTTAYPMAYVQPDSDGFITAGLLWTPGCATYYGNGKELMRFNNPRVSSVPSYILFDFVSGGWDNKPLDDTKLPDDFVVDYVRVWQRRDLDALNSAPTPSSTGTATAQ